jgi:hypothetical protein
VGQQPWWAIPVIAGLFALGGVIATQVVVITLDRRRMKREDDRRWHEDRRGAYSAYLAALHEAGMRLETNWQALPKWIDFDPILQQLRIRRQEVLLIATKPVREKADFAWNGFANVLQIVKDRPDVDPQPVLNDLVQRVSDFEEAARKELGVPD